MHGSLFISLLVSISIIMIKVKVLFFAVTRELVGIRGCDVELGNNNNDNDDDDDDDDDVITTESLMNELLLLYPSLLSVRDQIVLAVNKTYITDHITLKNGDEVALIPPISGG